MLKSAFTQNAELYIQWKTKFEIICIARNVT